MSAITTQLTAVDDSTPTKRPHTISSSTWRLRYATVMVMAVAGAAVDLATKHWIFQWLGGPSGKVYWVIPEIFGWETSINTGALWGMGTGHVSILAAISVIATIGILLWITFGRALEDWLVTIALGLILGGVIGNLYDRLGLWGTQGVRDWILITYKSFIWPNFNIADSLLVCGSALLVLHTFWAAPDEKDAGKTTPRPE